MLPIADRHLEYAHAVAEDLRTAKLRVDVDERTESVGKKIRDAETRKVPYMLVVGDRESEANEVAVRRHRQGDLGSMAVSVFRERAAREVSDREPPPAEAEAA
jgi:threonyl-tRNA synthetase